MSVPSGPGPVLALAVITLAAIAAALLAGLIHTSRDDTTPTQRRNRRHPN